MAGGLAGLLAGRYVRAAVMWPGGAPARGGGEGASTGLSGTCPPPEDDGRFETRKLVLR